MANLKSPLTLFFAALLVIALLALFGPEERSLGASVRIVYLHGAWVLAAELALIAAGLALAVVLYLPREKDQAVLSPPELVVATE